MVKPKLAETPVETPVEKVNTGFEEKPLVDTKTEDAETCGVENACPDHPEAKAVLYGMCTTCYDKLPKAKKRGLYLKARLSGSNTHNYPLELRRVWRREVALIEAGLWKRPLKTKTKTRLDEALLG
ncbi:unnamed protein product [marine sediment metagenome]|uniref:Uncharacterized protein n=1 Tax=marine sediment metagenome TaxID=412755 RepID=X0TP80_9ZZZZ